MRNCFRFHEDDGTINCIPWSRIQYFACNDVKCTIIYINQLSPQKQIECKNLQKKVYKISGQMDRACWNDDQFSNDDEREACEEKYRKALEEPCRRLSLAEKEYGCGLKERVIEITSDDTLEWQQARQFKYT